MALSRRWCRAKAPNIFLTIVCLAVLFLIINYFYSSTSSSHDDSSIDSRFYGNRHHGHRRKHRKHHVIDGNIQVCKHPKLSLQSDQNAGAFHAMPPLKCPGNALMYLTHGAVLVNRTILGSRRVKRCVYRAINRAGDQVHQYTSPHVRSKPPFGLRIKHDFFRVECFIDDGDVMEKPQNVSGLAAPAVVADVPDFDDVTDIADYDHFFAQIHPKQEVHERVKEITNEKKMDVLIMVIDSMSHLSYQRKLPKTYHYITNTLNSVILDGYTIVGDGTTPNIVALLTGESRCLLVIQRNLNYLKV